jgi:hypothetical protein
MKNKHCLKGGTTGAVSVDIAGGYRIQTFRTEPVHPIPLLYELPPRRAPMQELRRPMLPRNAGPISNTGEPKGTSLPLNNASVNHKKLALHLNILSAWVTMWSRRYRAVSNRTAIDNR